MAIFQHFPVVKKKPHPTLEDVYIVPFVSGLLLMLPTASLIGLLWLLWRMDGSQSQPQIRAT
jgi:hypothetical protein